MSNTKFVVMTGLPASGKSTVAKRLRDDYGFVRLNTDDLRQQMYGKNLGVLREDSDFELKEGLLQQHINFMAANYLSRGLDTVIDSTAAHKDLREYFLTIPNRVEFQNIDSYLLHVDSDPEIMRQRYIDRGIGAEGVIEKIMKYWESPADANLHGAEFITIRNNPGEDLPELYRALEKIIGSE